MTESGNYKNTVNLPKTQFDMRANALKREPEIQQLWAEQQIYERLSQNNPGEIFILHDGPPYANGSLHIGHALNKILKDIINKYQMLKGRKVRYVPGWDCHGLPIELKVLQDMKQEERQNLTPLELRQKAKDFALKAIDEQRKSFKRYGVWGDWENPYLTMTPEYEAAQIGVFGQMVLKGYIYRGLKPVHWSPSSKTALAEAELEYPEDAEGRPTHVSHSIYTVFAIASLSEAVRPLLAEFVPNLGVAIWTTTPWTIPANLAVSLNPDLTYAVVEATPLNPALARPEEQEAIASVESEVAQENEVALAQAPKYLIVARDLVEKLSATLATHLTVKATVKGRDLENCTYRHPLYDRESPIVIGGDYVTADSGTGLVHTAPGHGDDDYKVGQRYGLPLLSPVDENGNFTQEAGQFAGLNVLGDGNQAVIDALAAAGSLLKEEPYRHSYPYDWRTKKPTIYRATEQWFASVEGFREEALKAIASVKWIPSQGENRISPMVAQRSDWCISRQRSWGVPIPVFYDEETNEPLLNEETISHVQGIVAEKGSNAWWELSVEELLPESYRNNGRTYRKGMDTMDVWFDSGSSWAAVANHRQELHYPVDMYLEGSDQHRGWFQSSLLTSVATNGVAPYKTVLTHGFALDEQGRKMSKSVGNVVDPNVVIEGGKNQQQEPAYGADILRLWVSSVDYTSDVRVGKNILKQLGDIRGKIRNTARFLLGSLHDFDPAKDAIAYEELPELDRYMLHRITEVFTEVTEAFESYQFFRFFQTVQNFCVVDLSNFYLDIAKDRLYISAADSYRRRSCQTVLAIALENLARAIAPVLCHMAEDIWQYVPYPTPYKSVFESGWVKLEDKWKNPELATTWEKIREVRTEVNKVLEKARTEKAIGASLEAKVLLYVASSELRSSLQSLNPTPAPAVEQASSVSSLQEDLWQDSPNSLDEVETEEDASTTTEVHGEVYTPVAQTVDNLWMQALNQIVQPFTRSPYYLGKVVKEYKALLAAAIVLPLSLLPISLLLALVNSINKTPLLATVFELIGIWVTARYAFSDDGSALAKQLRSLIKTAFATKPPVEQSLSGSAGEELAATIVDENLTANPDAVKQPEVRVEPTLSTPSPAATGEPSSTNPVDELRYLFITSQVELVESPAALEKAQYKVQSKDIGIGVVKADGQKCDRCWNYSLNIGKSSLHPLLCERCVPALEGEF
ncbi:isoleucine--tRNA ligase [Microcoleus sp. FACHB-831]|uniref:isoleucine--tRNA ligase n=1 Tax=Microcoleus sp. FACHB-831 TaxID=2692827 RepID=UPI001682D500|nr:isoleucine--tRNA ligase [Microcoleus sp. FACHB-831]MBD1922287.1 isoleucine--tRNA ligase [Microcoleus sp. FACHB-831]